MDATAEIDKAGRFVVPKKIRDALQLVPGTKITLHLEGHAVTFEAETKPRGLYMKNGLLVYDTGPLPTGHEHWVDQGREDRAEELMGEWNKG